jgi:hypothetical protein
MIAYGTDGGMSANDWVGIVTVTVTIFALYASALAWLVGQSGRLRTETKRDIENLEAVGERGLDKIYAQESKSRQELAVSIQGGMLSLQQQVNQLRDASATKPELGAVEQRLATTLNEFRQKRVPSLPRSRRR